MNLNRSICLLIIVLTTCFSVKSQTFSTSANTVTSSIALNLYVTSMIEFQNVGSDTLLLKWDLLEKISPSGWDYSYCDYTTCYDGTTFHGTMAPLTQGSNGFIKVNAMTTSESWSYFKFRVYNQNDEMDADTIEFWFNGALNVDNNSLFETQIFPNPVKAYNQVAVRTQSPITSVEWIAPNGSIISTQRVGNLTENIFEAPHERGVYFLRLTSKIGTELQRILVQ
jgi:hypothetical protein